MIKTAPLTLDAIKIVKPYFKNITNSMYNFTTAYIWGAEKYVKYALAYGCLFLIYEFPKSPVFCSFPVGDGDTKKAVIAACEYMKERGANPTFKNISADMKDFLLQTFPEKFVLSADRNTFDYVYETERLINLNGKDLHAKRNHFNYFAKNYDYKYMRMTPDDVPECKALFDEWIQEKEESKWLYSSREATFRALDNLTELGLTGGLIKVDNKICAFSVGEAVSEDTALIHLEVASPFMRGVFNAINREFCANEWKDYVYVNREEDMGLSGLRQAKEAYRPAFLHEKFNAYLRED